LRELDSTHTTNLCQAIASIIFESNFQTKAPMLSRQHRPPLIAINLQRAVVCAHALRLRFSRICLFPGKIVSPLSGDIYTTLFPAMSQAILQSHLRCQKRSDWFPEKTLVDIFFLRICPFLNEICALSTKNDYTEIKFIVKQKRESQP
jgi:hypothetical protein